MDISRGLLVPAQARGADIRQHPFPFKAMLAICSDLDETPDRQAYWAVMQFLNSRETGPLGLGVGLEVGNSIYFDMPPDQFSYWGTDDRGRAMVRSLIESGHIDCLHSFGDLATHRKHAGRALDELNAHGCRVAVWVDHAVAPSNFGSDIMRGFGDVPGHPAYHSDLTTSFGIRYVWRGRVTSVIGQNQPPSLNGVWNRKRPTASLRTLSKEIAKRIHARRPTSRYRIHRANRLISPGRLRDGTCVAEFLRCNPHWGGVSSCDTADGIADVLTPTVIDQLVRRRGASVLYTHLGKRRRRGSEGALSAATQNCFRHLAERQSRGDVLVTTTRRLLDYCSARDHLRVSRVQLAHGVRFDLSLPESIPASRLQGLTLYTDDSLRAEVRLNGHQLPRLISNPADEAGRASVSIPWEPLTFPLP